MKILHLHLLIACTAATALAAPFPKKMGKMRDVVSHNQLSQKLRMAQQNDPLRELGPEIGKKEEDPAKKTAGRDLIASSTVLSFRGMLTLVPKQAVLHLPEKMQDRVGAKSGLEVKTFQDFYKVNRNWIRTMEVTREQALGHVPFEEATLTAIKESSAIIIATYKGGPISVLPTKDPETVPSRIEMKPVTYRK